jgi:hypothetical protein
MTELREMKVLQKVEANVQTIFGDLRIVENEEWRGNWKIFPDSIEELVLTGVTQDRDRVELKVFEILKEAAKRKQRLRKCVLVVDKRCMEGPVLFGTEEVKRSLGKAGVDFVVKYT